MSNKMLIDATHPEETRVVVLRGNRVEEFDFEAADRQQLRGNIYLAKVTRVEPSLQAAFVEYGGNRHGFLAFSEIHPDYYQIPFADRQALIQEQAREEEEDAAEEAAEEAAAEAAGQDAVAEFAAAESDLGPADVSAEDALYPTGEATFEDPAPDGPPADSTEAEPDAAEADDGRTIAAERAPDEEISERVNENAADVPAPEPLASRVEEVRDHDEAEQVESVGAVDALEEVPQRRRPRPRQYKIQEVIKRRQVLLVQVVKEERGNKGAALTTYLSLAGRYSVLMPNTGRGGGISRKITNPADRKRLKEIAGELDVPEGMGVILRTAGANRTKPEVKRDFEYLLRLWENVRELTLRSSAPKLVYEEGSLIKRSIRDLYSREIEQIEVAGEDAYREAKDFMRMLMPSHAKNVQLYRDDSPLFARSGVEAQLDAMFSPQVTLRSGGYIVINQTEALVSIDVNSGRSTREHSIEDTALNTNLEAAEEIARQLRLRDLAGLIVIDFIDMEEKRNNRAVERKMKDCLRADRARIQVGRISHFGLMEMSRQRLRTGVLESSTVSCPHCRGTGQVRSISSLSLQILRALEDNLLRHGGYHLYARTRPDAALYVLNQKRRHLAQLEARFGVTITVSGDAPDNGSGFSVERGGQVEERPERPERVAQIAPPEDYDDAEGIDVVEPEDDAFETAGESTGEPRESERPAEGRDKRRRRRRRRGGGDDRPERASGDNVEEIEAGADEPDAEEESAGGANRPAAEGEDEENGQDARRRRRGRRGGRRRGRSRENGEAEAQNGGSYSDPQTGTESGEIGDAAFSPADSSEQGAHFADRQGSREAVDDRGEGAPGSGVPMLEEAASRQVSGVFGDAEPAVERSAPSQEASRTEAGAWAPIVGEAVAEEELFLAETAEIGMAPEPVPVAEHVAEQAASSPEPIEDDRPKRSGWWSRKVFF